MNDKTGNTLREHVIVAGTDSNSKLKWLDDLVEDLLKAASNIKTVMEFQNKDFKADKPCQYKEVHKKIVNFFFHRFNEDWGDHISVHQLPIFYTVVSSTFLSFFVFSFSAWVFSIGCLALLFQNNISYFY